MAEPRPRLLSDIDALKALAHPLRQRVLARLQRQGPATSADLAGEFGEDRGATSYHLRQLARFGFIEEDTQRSAGRRRYWRAIPQDLRLPRRPPDPEIAVAAQHSFGGTTLNAEELVQFGEEYIALLKRWHRTPEHAAPGSRHITVVFHAFPTPAGEQAT